MRGERPRRNFEEHRQEALAGEEHKWQSGPVSAPEGGAPKAPDAAALPVAGGDPAASGASPPRQRQQGLLGRLLGSGMLFGGLIRAIKALLQMIIAKPTLLEFVQLTSFVPSLFFLHNHV